MKKTVRVKNLDELAAFAAEFAATLRGGDIIGLVGDLGAGKTTFVQQLAQALGVRRGVRSPTFVLMQLYDTGRSVRQATGIRQICHIDAYRLKNEDELYAIGFNDFVDRPDTVILMEWADRQPAVQWLDHYREVSFDFGGDGERLITVNGSLVNRA